MSSQRGPRAAQSAAGIYDALDAFIDAMTVAPSASEAALARH